MGDDGFGGGRADPTSDEIISALRNAGWLLEQDAAATLEKSGFHVLRSKAFPDPLNRLIRCFAWVLVTTRRGDVGHFSWD